MGNSPTSFRTGIGGTPPLPPANQTLPQLLRSETEQWKGLLRQALADLRCAAPAIVQQFNAETQTVTVQIAISELVRYSPNNNGGPAWEAIPPIFNVPILLPRAGGFCVTFPIQQGDEGLLVFADSMFDLWFQNGGQQPPPSAPLYQPNHERRRHDITDAIFIPGLWNQTRVLANYSTSSAQLRSDNDETIIDLGAQDVTITCRNLTVNASGSIALTSQGQATILSAPNNTEIDGKVFRNHLHSGVQTGSSDTGPVA